MGAEEVLYRFDPRKIRVVSGEVSAGYWELHSCVLEKSSELFKDSSASAAEKIDLDKNIANLEVKNIQDANPSANLLGIGVGALAGLRYFGPIGAIGGALAGQALVGNRHEVHLTITLKDGRSFVAFMDKSIYQRIQTIAGRPED